MKEEEGETPKAEEEDVTKYENVGFANSGKEKKRDITGDMATAEGVALVSTEGAAADAAAFGGNTAKEEKEKEVVLEQPSGGGLKEDKRVGHKPSPPEGAAGGNIDESAGGKGTSPGANAGTKIEELADAKPETLEAPAKRKTAAVAQEGEEKGVVERELPIPAGGGRPEGDSSDEDDGDGFRIVVGREVSPPVAPAAPTKRFLRGKGITLW